MGASAGTALHCERVEVIFDVFGRHGVPMCVADLRPVAAVSAGPHVGGIEQQSKPTEGNDSVVQYDALMAGPG